jgi:hypothetical protein
MTSPSSRGTFFRIRVAVLLVVLVGVILYAIHDVQSRRERKTWDHTLSVALVLLRDPSLGPLKDDALPALRARLPALGERLTEELHRYRPGAPPPFAFRLFGPVDVTELPPSVEGTGWTDLAQHTYALWRYLRPVDEAAGMNPSQFDSRIYVVVRPPTRRDRTMVEGESEEDGRIGTVRVELDASMADFTLFVATHELFHTLGASDRYDAEGHCVVPDCLAEPRLVPLYPQRFAEVMARNRPLSPTEEVAPVSLDELAVGPVTASEIGWAR